MEGRCRARSRLSPGGGAYLRRFGPLLVLSWGFARAQKQLKELLDKANLEPVKVTLSAPPLHTRFAEVPMPYGDLKLGISDTKNLKS